MAWTTTDHTQLAYVPPPTSPPSLGAVWTPTQFSSGDGLALGACGPVFIAYWSEQPTAARFCRQKTHLDEHVRKCRGAATFLCIVGPNCPPPEESLRKASAAMITRHEGSLTRVGCVILGSGFRAAATRAVLSGISLIARSSVPGKYFATAEDAAAWLIPEPGVYASAIATHAQSLACELARPQCVSGLSNGLS